MKYLFFDIECSNCFNGVGKMCEFGYVLTNEKFKIIEMDDIPMSPGAGRDCRFHLRDRMKREDVSLAYEEEYYFTCQEFPKHFERIRKLVCDSDTICFAYSSHNDIMHLYHSCKRYGKEPFNYVCYDVQKMVDIFLQSKTQTNLKVAFNKIVGATKGITYQEHLSRDDARMTADIFEVICKRKQLSPQQLMCECNNARDNSIEYVEGLLNKAELKKRKTEAQDLYRTEARKNYEKATLPEYVGKRYNLANSVKIDSEIVLKIIQKIQSEGNIVINATTLTDVFVVLDEQNKEELKNNISGYYSGKYIILSDLLYETKEIDKDLEDVKMGR